MKLNYLFIFLAVVWVDTASVHAQDNSWHLVKNADGIKVFSRENSKTKLDEVFVTAEANAPVVSLVSVIKDASNHKNWIYLCKKGKVIRHVSPSEWIYYSESNAPWPFEDRDVVTKVRVVHDTATNTTFIQSNSFKDSVPVKNNYIRIPYIWTQWAFTPEKNGFTKIQLKLTIDLGGNIPKWLMRLTASSGPYRTVKNLLAQVLRPKYKKVHSALISDP